MKKILYMILGCISVGLGAAGVVIPVLPTVPFLMFAAFCFAGSSKKLDRWFKNTKLYKENLADFAAGRGHPFQELSGCQMVIDKGAAGAKKRLAFQGHQGRVSRTCAHQIYHSLILHITSILSMLLTPVFLYPSGMYCRSGESALPLPWGC